jgi:hypothetical protein
MCTLFSNLTLVHDNNLVYLLNGRELVSYNQGSPSAGCSLKSSLDELFGLGIESGSGFIQQQDFGVRYQTPSNGDPLFLSATQKPCSLSYNSVIAAWKLLDEVMGVSLNTSMDD